MRAWLLSVFLMIHCPFFASLHDNSEAVISGQERKEEGNSRTHLLVVL